MIDKTTRLHRLLIWTTFLCCLVMAVNVQAKQSHLTELLSDNIDVEINQFTAQGDYLLLWIAPDYGFRKGQQEMASLLSTHGMETWMVDLNETLFLSRGSNAMREITGQYVSELITRAHERTGKKIVLVSSFYGAIPALRGARLWQSKKNKANALLGAILFSPALYSRVPALGKDPEYLPIADATNLPVMVFQGGANGARWQLKSLMTKLHASKSPAYFTIMPGISSLFYPEERSAVLDEYFQALPKKISQSIKLFEQSPFPKNIVNIENIKVNRTNLDIELKPFKGDPNAQYLKLKDINGKQYQLDDYKGKVTLVNFWATWCPPCVEEIPSLNRLLEKMDHPDFRLISVNYVEDADTIKKFTKKIEVKFPILLDLNGEVARDWKVFVFPSTFVVGTDGKIAYGVNAAINWDSETTIKQIKKLLPKQP